MKEVTHHAGESRRRKYLGKICGIGEDTGNREVFKMKTNEVKDLSDERSKRLFMKERPARVSQIIKAILVERKKIQKVKDFIMLTRRNEHKGDINNASRPHI